MSFLLRHSMLLAAEDTTSPGTLNSPLLSWCTVLKLFNCATACRLLLWWTNLFAPICLFFLALFFKKNSELNPLIKKKQCLTAPQNWSALDHIYLVRALSHLWTIVESKRRNSVMLFLMTLVSRCIETNTFRSILGLQGDRLHPHTSPSDLYATFIEFAFRFLKETATTILRRWGDSRSWWPSTSEYSQRGGLPLASVWGWRSSAVSCQVKTQAFTYRTADDYVAFNNLPFCLFSGMYSVCLLKCIEHRG